MGTEQKVAVITGASQGIGAGLVKAYRDRNYRVVATSRTIKPSNDDDVLAVPGDIADPKTAERVISQGVARFGRTRPPIARGCVLSCFDSRRSARGRARLCVDEARVHQNLGG